MKHAPTIASILLGLIFIFASVMYFAMTMGLMPADKMPPPPTEEAKLFMGALAPTGYLTFVKVLELVGAILVMIPKTRNFGLLVLGPIVVNIVAYAIFIVKGDGLANPMFIGVVVLPLYLLWDARQKFAALAN